MSRFMPLPLDTAAGAAEEAPSNERLFRVIQCVFAFGAVGRLFAAGYSRAVDQVAQFVQRASGLFGLHRIEYVAWEFRVGWCQLFEDKICAIARTRVFASIDAVMGFYADMGYVLPSNPKDVLYSRLMGAVSEDSVCAAQMAELQKLPIGRRALERRIQALDACVEMHMSALAHELAMGYMALDAVVSWEDQ